MLETPKAGRINVKLGPRAYQGEWKVVGDRVEVTSEFGVDTAPLGALRAAPATVAREKLAEMARRATQPARGAPAPAKPTMRDVMRWRP